ncbi:hypothetical protein LCGC14_0123830 [marine sediment metagenome]|uniref:DNA polymerase III subunit delta n=1 Tax=marine sediment metagenome TaxID=412755 RepID=A0A0F9V9C7_9ZZZZ|nr:DNA polymerase III subunit delta [Phycisphaerae bacterium]HDZ43112.1 DNA polymerase III subunit delta [Phycisphaerae bacterium]
MTLQPVKPVYVLVGTDAYLQDAHRQEIISAVVGEADPQIAVATYDASAELAEVLDALRTLPFLAARRAVVLRDADAFISANRETLEKYLQAPVETAVLVLMVSSWPKTTRLYKLVAKIGQTFDCAVPEKTDLRGWLMQAAKKRGKTLAGDAAGLLGEWIGGDYAALDGEIEKLSLYVGRRDTITLADVSALVTATAGPAAFALTDALTAGDAAGALTAMGGMLTVRGEEFRVLGLIGWHVRRVMQAHQMVAAGKGPDVAMKAVRVYYNRQQFANLLRRRPMNRLVSDFRRLLAADRAMKTGADAKTALQQLVVGLCAQSG